MLNPALVVGVIVGYLSLLLGVALWVERHPGAAEKKVGGAVIYSLALAVYHTAWTFYGSVGRAATSGFLFLAVYLGPTLVILLWGTVLRRMVRLKNRFRITSVADFISARYDKSLALGALATLVALIGSLPYISLQLRAVVATFELITHAGPVLPQQFDYVGPLVVVFLTVFTILVGIRRLDPTERHPGIVVSLALECAVKLVAFLAVGLFATYALHDGLGDLFRRLEQLPRIPLIAAAPGEGGVPWMTTLVLAMSAIMFLPRQFHVAVVENSSEDHIRTARWLFPFYMLLINFFVVPIAISGLLQGYPAALGDTFVLRLPLDAGSRWLSLLVFLGGFSAATGMVMFDSIAVATMVSNHLLLPLFDSFSVLSPMKRGLLRWRWLAVAGYIATGYLFARNIDASYMLVNIGMISFAAILQLAPAAVGALFWRKANKHGALLGLAAGFAVWFYTLLLPTFIKSGWVWEGLLTNGPLGLTFLVPESLFGSRGIDPLSHGVFWSMVFNVGFFVLGSLAFEQSESEESLAREFAEIDEDAEAGASSPRAPVGPGDIALEPKRAIARDLAAQFLPFSEAERLVDGCLSASGLAGRETISILQLSELTDALEKRLAGSLGAAMAHRVLKQGGLFTPEELKKLAQAYAELAAELKLTPDELKRKVDYYREREVLISQHTAQLERRVQDRTAALVMANKDLEVNLAERMRAEEAIRQAERFLSDVFTSIQDGIAVFDADLRVVRVNATMESWYADIRPLVGRSWNEVCPAAAGSEPAPAAAATLRTGTSADAETLRPGDAQRPARLLEVHTYPIVDAINGGITGVVGYFRDVTEQRAAEEKLGAARSRLLQSEKMAAVGQLASGVAHEINNPLGVILGFSQALTRKIKDDDPAALPLRSIEREAKRCKTLVMDLLAFSRTGRSEKSLCDLDRVVESALNIVEGQARAHSIELVKELAGGLPEVALNAGKIQQVVINLCGNAIDAMPQGGRITVRTARRGADLEVTVGDNGVGIPPELRSKVFEPFFTTKEVGRGTGLGLALVYEIVKNHDGRIELDSEVGRGTTFRVLLPISSQEAPDADAGKAAR